MKPIFSRLVRLLSFALATMLGFHTHAADVTIIDLGIVNGNNYHIDARSINASGQVVGIYHLADATSRSFLYSNGVMRDIGTLGGRHTNSGRINTKGQVVGGADTATGESRAFLYSDGVMTDLGTLGGNYSRAFTINDRGQIVGSSRNASGYMRAFLYSDGIMTDIGTLLGGRNAYASSINASGHIVGVSETASGSYHAFLYNDGVMIDLGTLGGSTSYAADINDSGQIVGWSFAATGETRAFLYSDGMMKDLGTLGGVSELVGGGWSAAASINSSGQIVGWSGAPSVAGATERPFLYSNGKMINLNDLLPPGSGWIELYHAMGINDVGQIVGNGGYRPRGNVGAFLLTLPQLSGLALSTANLALAEGGDAGSYTLALKSAPASNVNVIASPNNQLSASPTQLTFTSANWNIPQTVTVTAIHDGLAEGNHTGSVSHTVTSVDARYNGISVSNVTVAIADAIIPIINLSIPTGSYWTQSDLPLTGTAGAGTTVTITATNPSTGEVRAASAVAGADGAWSLTLADLTDGNYELRPEAGGIQGDKVGVAVDSHAPVSTLSTTSTSVPTASGWYNASVNLVVTAADRTGGSGLARSEYTLDGGAWTAFPNGGVNLNQDGNHTVCYRSLDRAGNMEAARCVPIAIDAAAPVVNPVFDSASNLLHLNAQDAGSGIGSIEISRDGGQNWTVQSGPIAFTRDGTHTVHYRVRDNASNLKTGQTTVTVVTVPNITAPAGQNALEAASSSFNLGSFSDQAADGPWNVDVDWGDGTSHSTVTLSAPSALGSLPHTYADNGSYSVTVKVTDQAGNSGSRSFPVTVANVAPTATFTAATGALNEGDVATLTFTNSNDVSPVDVQAGFRYAFDCGDGSGFGAVSMSSSMTCRAQDNPNQAVRGRVVDKDGGVTEYGALVVIGNVVPTLGAITGPTAPVVRDTPSTITASFADPGVRDSHTVTIDWDDGTMSGGTVTESNGLGTVSASHAYARPGRYTVTMTVTDKDGGSAMGTYTIQIRGGPPAR